MWKTWLAISCNHGTLADPVALDAVVAFRRKLKPHRVIHLGDNCDFTALRSGAKGSKDEAVDLASEIEAGVSFLQRLEPTDLMDGNHDARARMLADHPDAKIRYCAQQLGNEIDRICHKMKIRRYDYDIDKGWLQLGDCLFGHGYMFNEHAIRDHAETFGKCVIGHLHRVGQATARVAGGATAYCVGYLGQKEKFSYANTRRARLAWSQGFAWGEYNDKYCHVRLEQVTPLGWRLPL